MKDIMRQRLRETLIIVALIVLGILIAIITSSPA